MKYYVHKLKDAQGDHEVHTEDCKHLPLLKNREYLDDYPSCAPAVQLAKNRGYHPVNGCYWCCNPCHTS